MIKQLDRQLINKIAAGEVVDRPLSVVKELAENAIDANATAITVEIKDGGTSFIRVTDNGSGIPTNQVMLAFALHATSKISDIDDLTRIGTLGFRGEALASIASVSQIEMITKTAGELSGSRVELHGGTLIARQDIGCIEGTTINVSNLFFNTPARLKFLKKPATEAGYVTDLMQRLALGYPHLAIRYISGGQIMIATNGNGDLKTVIYSIYGKDVARGLISVDNDNANSAGFISGYIGRPENARGSRSGENFFINGRYIKSELLQSAVEDAYRERLASGRFPLCVLHLRLEPQQVDVNVHPAKLEVRFADEREIHIRVNEAVRAALSSSDLTPIARPPSRTRTRIQPVAKHDLQVADEIRLPNTAHEISETHEISDAHEISEAPETYESYESSKPPETYEPSEIKTSENPSITMGEGATSTARSHEFSIIAQIFSTYWLAVREDELFLIDQHAAHERILYEEKQKQLKNQMPISQPLIEPQKLNLSPKELEIATEHKKALFDFGFEFDDDKLTAVPAGVDFAFFAELLDKLESGSEAPISKIREEIAMAACKAAVKANDLLGTSEARSLINRMLTLENPYFCPHGRPTMVKLTKREIERMFNRT